MDEERPTLVLKQVREPRTPKQERLAELINEHAEVDNDPESAEYGAVTLDPVLAAVQEQNFDDIDTDIHRSYLWQIVGEFFTVLPENFDFDAMSDSDVRKFYMDAFSEGFDHGFRKAMDKTDDEEATEMSALPSALGIEQTQS